MALRIVGLTGAIGSGKDAAGALLRMAGFRRLAFGDGVREEVEAYVEKGDFAWSTVQATPEIIADFYEIRDKKLNVWAKPTPDPVRRVLQWWGTEFRRAQDPQYWVKYAMSQVPATGVKKFVFTDVRFLNELQAIKAAGGTVWRVVRPGVTHDMAHESERQSSMLPVDHHIRNKGTMQDLASEVITGLHIHSQQ